jgi:hypothetical protein
MQVCWSVLNKESRKENPIYRRPLSVIFKTPRGRAGKPRKLTPEEYYNAKHETSYSTGNLQNPRSHGGN